MGKALRITLFIILACIPIIFYSSFNKKKDKKEIPIISENKNYSQPEVALIFDDLGESLKDLKSIYALDIPVTVSIIPGLKFSKNIAYISDRCGYSVFIHLPLGPKNKVSFQTMKYSFIDSSLSHRQIDSLLKSYLNSLRVAIGVNNHMGSEVTENPQLMKQILKAVKSKGLIFVDSRTSLNSVAYDIAKTEDLICGYNEGFLDSVDDVEAMNKKFDSLLAAAREKGKIIIIAHPKEKTFKLLKQKLPQAKEEVNFVTMKDYFD